MTEKARFEAGKTYKVIGRENLTITVTKRTAHYITYTGDFTGRSWIQDKHIFGINSEYAWVGEGNFKKSVFAKL